MRKFLLLLFVIVATSLTGTRLFAQGVTTAAVHGVVTDSKGGSLPGASVAVTHVPTGTVYSASTRADGRFNIPNLRVGGPYTVKITFIGFKDYLQTGITLSIGQDQTFNVKLQDNSTDLKEVQVTASGSKVINSSRTGARETVSRSQIDALPTINRSLTDFTKLTPSANGLNFGGRQSAFNNITVDGALFNNSFGLSGTLGGQTSSQPISLDAIDQIQVDIAPFDVRQGNFTGAGVNTVVKSGTNEIKATIYDYVRKVSLTGYQAGVTGINVTPFTYHTIGASVGGAIVQNKLFLFVSGEQERISNPANTYVANRGTAGNNVSNVTAADLDGLKTYLQGTYQFDPGSYENFNYATSSDKLTVKLDWNINKNNTLSAKYFYLKSYKDQPPSSSSTAFGSSTRFAGPNSLPFSGDGYRINNNFNIGILELNTKVSNTMSNRATIGYSALRDFRTSLSASAIPMVDIGNGVSTVNPVTGAVTTTTPTAVATSFGYEQFTAGNLLNTNTWQFSDDFTIYAGKHEITIGTNDQIQSYKNGFATQYNGVYAFNSFYEFEHNLPAQSYTYRNSALPDGSFPYAYIKGAVIAAYVQDKWQATDNLKVTYGLRADLDIFPTNLQQNANVPPLTFKEGLHVDPSVLPKNRILLSPRLGFNWDVKGDQSTQIRGGTGLFTGAVPFVWISNQASNNGVLFSSGAITKGATTNTAAQNAQLIFNSNVDANRPTGTVAANTTYELDITDPNLKLPKIWRTNLAIDQKLPGGFIGTIEGAYTKDINAILYKNMVISDSYQTLPGAEGQIRYDFANTTARNTTTGVGDGTGTPTAANPKISGLYYMTNTNKGYSYFVTAQLQKSFLNGFYANVAYTYSQSKSVIDAGSTASTTWSTRYVAGDPNADVLANSAFVQPNRVIASIAYRKEYAKNFATSVGLTLESANNGAVSYLTSGDPNGDGASNDLMYIPKSASDIVMVATGTAGDNRTPAQQYAQLAAFINQDPYLSRHKGEFAERNGAIMPYYQNYNLNISQDFYVKSGKYKNTIRVEFNIINLGNFLDKNWGLAQVSAISGSSTATGNGAATVLTYKGKDATGRATYSFPLADATNGIPYTSSYKYDNSQFSRWQAQLGVRYIFN